MLFHVPLAIFVTLSAAASTLAAPIVRARLAERDNGELFPRVDPGPSKLPNIWATPSPLGSHMPPESPRDRKADWSRGLPQATPETIARVATPQTGSTPPGQLLLDKGPGTLSPLPLTPTLATFPKGAQMPGGTPPGKTLGGTSEGTEKPQEPH